MIKYLLSAAILLSSFSLIAQDSSTPIAETPKIRSIRKMLTLTGAGKMGIQMMQSVVASYKTAYTSVDPSFWDEFMKEVSPQDLENLVIPIYDRNFTTEEIDGMIAFYSSPLGQKVLAKMPVVMAQSMEAGKTWGQDLSQKLIKKLQQKGYIKEG